MRTERIGESDYARARDGRTYTRNERRNWSIPSALLFAVVIALACVVANSIGEWAGRVLP